MRREGYELAVSKPRVVFQRSRRREARADRAGDGRHRGPAPGRRDAGAGRAQGELVNMETDGRGRVRLEYRIPARGPDRLLQRVHEPDARHRPDQQHLRRLRGLQGRDRRPQERRADQHGRRRDLHLRAGQARRPRPHVRQGRRPGLRRHDRRHPQPRQRPGGQRHAHQAADQLPRQRQGRRDQDHAADRPDAGVRGRVHRRRRAGRDHAQEHPRAQAP
jgi:hypothetical protein